MNSLLKTKVKGSWFWIIAFSHIFKALWKGNTWSRIHLTLNNEDQGIRYIVGRRDCEGFKLQDYTIRDGEVVNNND